MKRNDRKPDKIDSWLRWGLVFCLAVILFGVLFISLFSTRGHAEDFSLADVPEVSESSEVSSDQDDKKDDQEIVMVQNATVDPEFEINNDTHLYAPSAQRATYAPAYDITSSDSYVSMLYDVFLNQGNVYDDFIIYRSGDYQYVLIYGSIKDDLSFKNSNVVTLNVSSYSSSGKRYQLSYTTGSGSFSGGHFNFLSNIKTDNALLFHNYYVRREIHACRIALYILAVLTVFNLFKFFRGGLRSI